MARCGWPIRAMWQVAGLLVLGLGAAGCNGTGASAGDLLVIDRAESLHRALGPVLVQNDASFAGYIQSIGDRLVAAARELHQERVGPPAHFRENSDWMFSPAMRFHLVNNATVNVVSTGGQHVYVYSAFMERCATEDELAAAMAHAYAHIYARHVERDLKNAGVEVLPAVIVRQLVENRCTLAQEQDADEFALSIYVRAGWDIGRFPDVYARSPGNQTRIATARARAASLPPSAQDYARPPVADSRRFAQRKQEGIMLAQRRTDNEEVRRLLTALPGCVASEDTPEQKLAQKELLMPQTVENPDPFEKGPRHPR